MKEGKKEGQGRGLDVHCRRGEEKIIRKERKRGKKESRGCKGRKKRVVKEGKKGEKVECGN